MFNYTSASRAAFRFAAERLHQTPVVHGEEKGERKVFGTLFAIETCGDTSVDLAFSVEFDDAHNTVEMWVIKLVKVDVPHGKGFTRSIWIPRTVTVPGYWRGLGWPMDSAEFHLQNVIDDHPDIPQNQNEIAYFEEYELGVKTEKYEYPGRVFFAGRNSSDSSVGSLGKLS